jgi:[acyl-carrier-protein] S-malonyltransferase
MCPGQGAQRVGRGKDLAERFPVARDTFGAIDETLGVPLSRIMWEGPEDELTLTHNAQPAILAHTTAVLAVVGERLGLVAAGAGHSLVSTARTWRRARSPRLTRRASCDGAVS